MNPLQGNVLFGLLAAVLWGGGDFSGAIAVKHAGGSLRASLRVILFSHTASFAVLLGIAALRGDTFPHGLPLAWGIAAGVAGGLSLACFYIALSRGAMGASAALSGLLAAAIPAGVSIAAEGSPGALRICGFALAAAAIWMIAAGPNPESKAAEAGTIWLALTAGIGFGIYFVALKMAGVAGLVWPMATARMGSITVCSLLLASLSIAGQGVQANTNTRVLGWALATAALDTSGNLLFIAATRAGRLDVAAVLASLYPASTILLAAWTLRERPTTRQGIGMAIAALAVTMITL